MSEAIVKADTEIVAQPARAVESGSLLAAIAQAVSDPRVDVAKMERLLAMHQTIMEDQRKAAYMAAMSRLQAKLPQINKAGRIIVKGTERSRYAKIEDIDVAIRPLLAEEGFAFSFDSDSSDAKIFKLSCKLSHAEGYSETKCLTLPMDASEYRSNVQSIGSTVSYGKRQLIKMHLNLVEHGEDTDGVSLEPISDIQAHYLNILIDEVKVDRPRFLVYMGVGKIEEILSKDYRKAINAIEVKRRSQP